MRIQTLHVWLPSVRGFRREIKLHQYPTAPPLKLSETRAATQPAGFTKFVCGGDEIGFELAKPTVDNRSPQRQLWVRRPQKRSTSPRSGRHTVRIPLVMIMPPATPAGIADAPFNPQLALWATNMIVGFADYGGTDPLTRVLGGCRTRTTLLCSPLRAKKCTAIQPVFLEDNLC
jgi:hypothetical protein